MKHAPFAQDPTPFAAPRYHRVTVLGSGSWGTALASTLARAGVETRLWGRDAALADEINTRRTNSRYLGDAALPAIHATTDLAEALDGAEACLLVIPSTAIRATARAAAPHMPPGIPVAICAKGIEESSGLLLSDVAAEELPGHSVGCVSGPTFAHETAMGYPTASTVAFEFSHADRLHPDKAAAVRLAVSLTNESFRAYVSDDLVGVEIGGAVKNVIAIACGMMTGAGFAENTRAALITRGLDEMKALAEALGGRRETVTGLSGIGDLTLTCSSTTSRNMALGTQLGQGLSRDACFDGAPVVVEGELNAASVTDLAARVGVEMPICQTVRAILHDGADLAEAFAALWARPIQAEPRSMQLSISHPSTETDIARLAERIK
ncbi:MAG: NAD(P)H-dependent glycerol-3-phosphate dehydrogenase [Pseudomonadota bacterium]